MLTVLIIQINEDHTLTENSGDSTGEDVTHLTIAVIVLGVLLALVVIAYVIYHVIKAVRKRYIYLFMSIIIPRLNTLL